MHQRGKIGRGTHLRIRKHQGTDIAAQDPQNLALMAVTLAFKGKAAQSTCTSSVHGAPGAMAGRGAVLCCKNSRQLDLEALASSGHQHLDMNSACRCWCCDVHRHAMSYLGNITQRRLCIRLSLGISIQSLFLPKSMVGQHQHARHTYTLTPFSHWFSHAACENCNFYSHFDVCEC